MIQPRLQPAGGDSGQRKVLTVSELNLSTRRLLERELGQIWISGELSNVTIAASGHWYFTLKDAGAQVRCAMFRQKNRLARFRPADGQQILLRAKVSLYEPRGDYQLIGEYIEPAGEGALQLEFARLKARLETEGLFDPARKRPLPDFPTRLGVITSPTGAAIRDVLKVLNKRMPSLEVVIYPAQVQGKAATGQLIAALETANRRREVDLLLLTRGGGSLEDLWCFNEEALARALIASDLPVVSAVGHEVDTSIADFVADARAPTPSAAAEMIAPDRDALLRHLRQLQSRLRQAGGRRIESLEIRLHKLTSRLVHPREQLQRHQQRLDQLHGRMTDSIRQSLQGRKEHHARLEQRLALQNPALRIERLQHRLQGLQQQLSTTMTRQLERCRHQLGLAAQTLHAVSPLATLERGYSITRRADTGAVLKSASELAPGDTLLTRLHTGEVQSRVIDAKQTETDGKDAD